MQSAAIESYELTSQSNVYFSDVLLMISLAHPMFSGVYDKIDHVFNRTDHQPLKKRRCGPVSQL
jgi:hypothetical protein